MLTDKMLEDRKNGIMGSMAAIIMGVARWGDLHWLYCWLKGLPTKAIVETLMMRIGNFMEPFIAILYTEETGNKVQRVNRTIWHKKHRFIGGHPDRLIRGDRTRGLEIKCVFLRGERDWENGVPSYYVAQVLHYALCTGRLKWDFAVLFMAHARFEIYTIEFTKHDLDELCSKEVSFWQTHIEGDVEPDVSSRSADTLKELWKTSEPDKTEVADEVVLQYVRTRKALKEKIDLYKDQLELHDNKIRARLKDAETLVAPTGETLTTYKTTKSGSRRFNFNFEEQQNNGNTNAH